eukprot:6192734-Pleurochrysis_carterae.AAC.3
MRCERGFFVRRLYEYRPIGAFATTLICTAESCQCSKYAEYPVSQEEQNKQQLQLVGHPASVGKEAGAESVRTPSNLHECSASGAARRCL